jgi:hypothetical protein
MSKRRILSSEGSDIVSRPTTQASKFSNCKRNNHIQVLSSLQHFSRTQQSAKIIPQGTSEFLNHIYFYFLSFICILLSSFSSSLFFLLWPDYTIPFITEIF